MDYAGFAFIHDQERRQVNMDLKGKCKMMKIYISEDSKYKGHNLYHALVLKLKEMGMAGVTVSRGIEGFGQEKCLHSAHILDLTLSLPIIIEVVDLQERIEQAVPAVEEMVNEGLVLVTDVEVVKYGKG
jgi:PII-like signaling protein